MNRLAKIGVLLGAIVGVCAGVLVANFQGWYTDYYSYEFGHWVTEDVKAWTSTICLAIIGGIIGGVLGARRKDGK
ncbi:MAG: hypothetical protein OXN17_07865 [Candidatus Poribacteria bacterium]|nr:hypothetical protein [Candidatus Poribacteria bacterium]MDE0505912.1 hypothetical protein [Candidatus Poribacteria bacterium]